MKYFLLVVLSSAISFSCSTGNSQTEFTAVNSSEKIQPAANQKIKSDFVKNDTSKVKGLYLAEPKDDGNLIIPGSSLISIFYENGDFGRLDLGLQKKKDGKTEIFGFFDEVVEFGNW